MNEIKTIIPKPIASEAIEVTEENIPGITEFLGGEEKRNILFGINYKNHAVTISKEDGVVLKAKKGDWIVKDLNGEFWPCASKLFKKTYDIKE